MNEEEIVKNVSSLGFYGVSQELLRDTFSSKSNISLYESIIKFAKQNRLKAMVHEDNKTWLFIDHNFFTFVDSN